MYNFFLAIFLICLIHKNLDAQRFLPYFGGDIGFSHSIPFLYDTNNELITGISINSTPTFGGYIGLKSKKKIWGELGLYAHNLGYRTECFSRLNLCGLVHLSPSLVEFANRYGYDQNIYKKKFFVSPSLGYRLVVDPNHTDIWSSYERGSSSFVTGNNSNSSYVNGEVNYGLGKKTYYLLELGLALKFPFKHGWDVSIIGRYLHGFTRIYENRFFYKFEDGTTGNGVYWQNGGYWMFGISTSYTFMSKNKA